jgi:hypothetical protein
MVQNVGRKETDDVWLVWGLVGVAWVWARSLLVAAHGSVAPQTAVDMAHQVVRV